MSGTAGSSRPGNALARACIACLYGLWLAAVGVIALMPAPGTSRAGPTVITGMLAKHQDPETLLTTYVRQVRP